MGKLNRKCSKFMTGFLGWGMILFFGSGLIVLNPLSVMAGEAELRAEIDRLWAKINDLGGGTAVEEGNWADSVTISGVVEVEVGAEDDGTDTTNDIALATVELVVEAEVSDFSSASVLFLYEGDGNIEVDEAVITIGNTEKNPVYLTAGRMYVPFGNYETQMISDPITLEIGEAQEDALQVGIEAGGFYGSAYTFNGDTSEGGADRAEHYGANIGYAFESDAANVDVGAGWISSLRDTNGLFDLTHDNTDPDDPQPVESGPKDFVAGYAVHLIAGFGPVTLIGEYVTAADDVWDNGPTQVSAYNIEAGVSFTMGSKEGSIAVGYQKTDEAYSIGGPVGSENSLPEKIIVAAFGVELMDGTALAFEWLNAEDYAVNDGADVDVYTLQLASEF